MKSSEAITDKSPQFKDENMLLTTFRRTASLLKPGRKCEPILMKSLLSHIKRFLIEQTV